VTRDPAPVLHIVTMALLSVLLGACATTPTLTPEASEAWQRQQQSIARLEGWSLVARMVLSSDDDAWNGKLWWQQGSDRYRIRFSAPFGQGGIELDGDAQGVEMRIAGGQTFHAVDAETLMYKQLGWYLPLSGLRYWVTGVPEPRSHADFYLDSSGQLTRLDQAGWEMRYPAYRRVGDLQLPRKVFMESDELSLRLVIDRWEPVVPGGPEGGA